MPKLAWTQYDAQSEFYFETYERLAFDKTHAAFLPFLPKCEGSRCLDVGAGSGRDSAALALCGYHVTAVEPSTGLRAMAARAHAGLAVRWVEDSLPQLCALKACNLRYDFILVSAVWMHLAPDERQPSLRTLAGLIESTGVIAITLRLGPPDRSRVMFPVSVEEVLTQAARVGLAPRLIATDDPDSLGREEVRWAKLAFSLS